MDARKKLATVKVLNERFEAHRSSHIITNYCIAVSLTFKLLLVLIIFEQLIRRRGARRWSSGQIMVSPETN
jgi:hypothetical protein